MFVSSYNTYINTNASDKNVKQKYEKQSSESNSFDSKFMQSSAFAENTPDLPINYITKSQFLYNKQEVETQQQKLKNTQDNNLDKTKESMKKFTGQNTLLSAKSAYESNSKMFSLFQMPHVALDQTPKIGKELPKKLQELKESSLRHQMVNTYIENDRYYQITA